MKLQTRSRLFLTALLLSVSGFIYSTNYYWIATTTANWNTGSNWSTTSGGAGGSVVPGSGDIANFDGSRVGNCAINATVNVAGFIVASGYTGTISHGAIAITVGTSNASFSGGTFSGGSAAITINGTFTLSGTAFTSTTNILTLASTVTHTSGTFTHNNGMVNFNSTGAQTIPAWSYFNLTISGARTTNNVTLVSSGTIGVTKTFNNFATFTTGSIVNTGSTVDYNGTLAQTIAAVPYKNLTSSSTGARALASTGIVKIAGVFTKGTNTYSNIGSTGEGFTPQNSNVSSNVASCYAVDATTAFVAGDNGVILKTTDGGVTWIAQNSTVTSNLRGISFYDSNNGLVIGLSGLVLRTTNGGTTWAAVATGTTQNFAGICYLNSSTVLISLGNGTIIKSTNGGATWGSPISTGTTNGLYGMYFTDVNTGYVVGLGGVVYKTTNAGANWTSSSSGIALTNYLFTSVYFTDALTGYISGFYNNGSSYDAAIYKTTNAGASWSLMYNPNTYLGFIEFVNSTTGYACGGNVANNTGNILMTKDAGVTWTISDLGTNRLAGIKFASPTTGYISGLNGAIIKFTCCSNGSTVDYNGTAAQTVPAFNYHNLTLSGARTTNSITLANSGTIGISGSISKTATFTTGSIVTTSSTVDLNGTQVQTIPAFTFNNLNTNSTGKKSVTGALTVNGTLNLVNAEVALAGNALTMASNTYSVVTRTAGYISNTAGGKLSRPTASTNAYLFPIGYKTTNDSADYFTFALNPGKSAAQKFDGSLNSNNTGFVVTHDKTLYGTSTSTVSVSITTSSYNPLQIQYDINTTANISAVRVTDQNDNTLKTMDPTLYSITGGNQLNFLSVYKICLMYSKTIVNSKLNWTYEISYDGNGYPVGEQMQYMDLLGRPTQTQVRNVADNTVLATQAVYDNYGQAALQTLPAPIGSVIAYQNKFITNNVGNAYTYTDFDKPVTTNNYPGEVNNPVAVSNSTVGTLGSYYSDNNTLEAYQATTSYPYSRAELTGAGRRAAAGDEYRMGAGHESKGYSMVSGDELQYIFGTSISYKDTVTTVDKMANNALTIAGGIQASKTISVDADGKEVVSYDVGGMPIASCYTGITGACTMTAITNTMVYAGTSSVDIHLPAANKSSLILNLPYYFFGGAVQVNSSEIAFKITDVATNTVLALTTDYTINGFTQVVTFLGAYATKSSVFRISFAYTAAKLSFFTANNITIPNVQVNYALDYSRWSVNYYDLAGRLRKSVSPKGINCSSPGTINFATTYDYSSKGQLIASKSADEGLKEMTYDDEGKPRFSQDAVQKAANKFSYTNYDAQARVVESGEYTTSNNGSASVFFRNYYGAYSAPFTSNTPSTSIINNTGNTGMRVADCGDINNIYYYPLAIAEAIPAGYTYKSSYSARYTMGKVCKTKNANSATWYGYNQMGQTMFTVQQMLDADYIAYQTTINTQIKTVDYNYNTANGTLIDQTYQKNNGTSEKLKHIFTYDGALRLTQVDVSIAGAANATQEKYYYYKTGALKRKEVGDKLQGIDYIYTVNGQLKSINNPALDSIKDPGQDGKPGGVNATFGKDAFGLALDYHTNDYMRTGSNVISISSGGTNMYNGMISEQRYKARALTNSVNNGANHIDYGGANQQTIITGGITDEYMHQYSYDEEYRLSKSVFGKFTNNNSTFTANTNNCYKEYGASTNGGINYDANGNITTLKRNAYNGTLGITMDDFTYTYTSNTNKLASIVDAATSTYTNDFDAATSKTFTYNSNGEMTASQAENVNTITYYNTGLTKKVTFSNNNTAEYWYDDRGQKIKTKYYNVATAKAKYSWYVNDAGGNTLAIYEYDQADAVPTFKIVEEPLYGNGRMATLDKVSGVIDYEITDHLGNVRVTIKGISTGVYEITSRTDYYAFGGAMPGRTYNLNSYRYNFQGQELAVNSNWQSFELRLHNSDLGRWMSPDPYGQNFSPYTSMDNEPVSMIDPSGGWGISFNLGFFSFSYSKTEGGEVYSSHRWFGGFGGGGARTDDGESGNFDDGGGSSNTVGGSIPGGSGGPGGGGSDGAGGGEAGHFDQYGIWQQPTNYYAQSLDHDYSNSKDKLPYFINSDGHMQMKHPNAAIKFPDTGPIGNNKPPRQTRELKLWYHWERDFDKKNKTEMKFKHSTKIKVKYNHYKMGGGDMEDDTPATRYYNGNITTVDYGDNSKSSGDKPSGGRGTIRMPAPGGTKSVDGTVTVESEMNRTDEWRVRLYYRERVTLQIPVLFNDGRGLFAKKRGADDCFFKE